MALDPFTVTSSSVGYGAAALASSGRLNVPYIDISQSASVVTSELIKDANLDNSAKVLTYVPNVETTRSSDYQGFSIRGLATGIIYFDGFPITPGSIPIPNIDTAFTDRVEVVKGPSSTAFGRGDPAGFINYVMKAPSFTRSTETDVTVGTGGSRANLRFVFDNNGLVTEDGNTAYRFVTSFAQGSGTRDASQFTRAGTLLAVDRRFGDRGDLKVNGEYFQNHSGYSVGNLSFDDPTLQVAYTATSNGLTPANIPALGANHVFNYDGSGIVTNLANLSAVLTYKVGDFLHLRQAIDYTDKSGLGQATSGNVGSVRASPNGLTVSLPANQFDYENHSWSYQADFFAERESSFLTSKYTLLFGGDVTDQSYYNANQLAPGVGTQLLLSFNPHTPIAFTQNIGKVGLLTKGNQWSPYVQLQDSVFGGKLQVSAAVRYIYFDQQTVNMLNNAVTLTKVRTPLLPTGSLLFKPLKWLSVYGLISKYQVAPTTIREYGAIGGAALPSSDPRSTSTLTTQASTELHEMGVKGELLKDKVYFSFAVFDVRNSGNSRNVILVDALEGSVIHNFVSNDKVTGWEAEVFGQPTKRLTVMLGAGALHSHSNVPSNGVIYNLEYPGNPDTVQGNIKYNFGEKTGVGLAATVGAKTYLSGWSANFNGVGSLGDFPYPNTVTLVNFGLSYGFSDGKSRVGFRVDNAFHRGAQIVGSYLYAADGRLMYFSFDRKF